MERTRDNVYKLYQETLHFDRRNKFFTVRTMGHCNNLPRDAVESPPLQVFKRQLDRALDNLT